ncbi:unnamed protein product [Prorocentrum cordatum]|uniref:PAP-associated domain-containing protein n=1 Tax=Prorocentrum cordatum TaxID=2364126 RepID=A0ABN9QD83_9DINO|nr:unnamed protein product [Polarella glacialis]
MACARVTQTPFLGELKLRGDARSLSVVAAATVCSFLPLSTSHVISLLVGVVGFVLAQALQPSVDRDRKPAPNGKPGSGRSGALAQPASPHGPDRQQRRKPSAKAAERAPAEPPQQKAETWKPSAVPVQAPTFSGQGWEAEVEELLLQLTPTTETTEAVAEIACAVKRAVQPLLPGAEVTGFVGASLSSGKAFGVAVPEVDIVISATPEAMASRMAGRRPGKQGEGERTPLKLRKAAVRACTDRLVSEAGFKFRRSAFRGEEPKVVVISPPALRSVPMNLSVNTVTPVCNAALLAECARVEPRAQGLVLLVKRWAKDRGLCHVARGHLSLYSWALLSVYFLQVGEGGLLPPLEGGMTPSGLAVRCRGAPAGPSSGGSAVAVTVAGLLQAFFRFYGAQFDWRAEAVSVRAGTRGAPGARLPLHIICDDQGQSPQPGPSIEDPFDATCNLGTCMTAASLQHLRSEFVRADKLCSQGASLSELLEPWAPQAEAASPQASEGAAEE